MWKEIAKRKTKLGNKTNFVHDAIFKNQLGEQTDQEPFQKMLKPITTKLDDVVLGGLRLPTLPRKHGKKMPVLDYGIQTYDENIPDYGLDDLFDEDGIQPEINKWYQNHHIFTFSFMYKRAHFSNHSNYLLHLSLQSHLSLSLLLA